CTECEVGAGEIKTPVCLPELENSASAGGTDTLQMLSIDKGYWRTTDNSADVRPCYNGDACVGG
ncbi:unnamed protein product, partial [Sphacelaria rigidula]